MAHGEIKCPNSIYYYCVHKIWCHICLLPWSFKSSPWWKIDDMMLMIMIDVFMICCCMKPIKTGWWHEWKWNYMLFYDLWISDIVNPQQRFEPLSHNGRPIDVTMPDKHRIEVFYNELGLYSKSRDLWHFCHYELISGIARIEHKIIWSLGRCQFCRCVADTSKIYQ